MLSKWYGCEYGRLWWQNHPTYTAESGNMELIKLLFTQDTNTRARDNYIDLYGFTLFALFRFWGDLPKDSHHLRF